MIQVGLLIMVVALITQIPVCIISRSFNSQQMKERGAWPGFPLTFHVAFWANFMLVPIFRYMAGRYPIWTGNWHAVMIVSIAISGLMHWNYTKGASPACHNEGGKLTFPGWLNLIFMAMAIFYILRTYFGQGVVQSPELAMITMILAVYLIVGTLIPPASVEGERVTWAHWLQAAIFMGALITRYALLPTG